jgi:hypothetical protein
MDHHEAQRSRTWLGVSLIVTPIVWLATEAVSPALKSTSGAQLAVIAQHPNRWYWYTVLLVLGTMTLIPAAFGVVRLTGAGSRRLSVAGGMLVAFSSVVAVGDAMTQFVSWQMVSGGAERAQMAALLDRYDNSSATSIFFMPGGLALIVGTVLLAVAVRRSRVAPLWASISFAVGTMVDLVGFMSSSVAVITIGAAIAAPGFVLLGRRLTDRSGSEVAQQVAALATT